MVTQAVDDRFRDLRARDVLRYAQERVQIDRDGFQIQQIVYAGDRDFHRRAKLIQLKKRQKPRTVFNGDLLFFIQVVDDFRRAHHIGQLGPRHLGRHTKVLLDRFDDVVLVNLALDEVQDKGLQTVHLAIVADLLEAHGDRRLIEVALLNIEHRCDTPNQSREIDIFIDGQRQPVRQVKDLDVGIVERHVEGQRVSAVLQDRLDLGYDGVHGLGDNIGEKCERLRRRKFDADGDARVVIKLAHDRDLMLEIALGVTIINKAGHAFGFADLLR